MKQLVYSFFVLSISLSACGQSKITKEKATEISGPIEFHLNDYLGSRTELDQFVDSLFKTLDDTAKVAQLIMPAIGPYGEEEATIFRFAEERKIGGILLLNGTKEQFTKWVNAFDSINVSKGSVPYLYSADAEPTLFNRKIKNTPTVKKAAELKTQAEVVEMTKIISDELNQIGINYNFSPVVDLSTNKTVGYRGFGQNPENIIPWSNEFIQVTQNANIIATAKHFPGHGLVSGDTHKSLQVIDGELKETKYYPPLIEKGVLSIMVGHLAVMNNPKYGTEGLPATISTKIVNELLIKEMGFKGLIVTDAMNMGGVTSFKQAELRSIKAGCDIALMPKNTDKAFQEIHTAYKVNEENFKARADESIKKVIRMKVCLGLIKPL
jgi:beta-N-acetylhexosaminidase